MKFLGRWSYKNLLLNEEELKNELNERNINLGLEMEVYLINENVTREEYREYTEQILEKINNRYIYKDYYPYQIEIRTPPSRSPEEIVQNLINNFNEAKEIVEQTGGRLLITSMYENLQFCGMHIHISFDSQYEQEYEKIAKVLYYFIWDTVLFCANSKYKYFRSFRLVNSPHIAPITLDYNIYRNSNSGDYGYYDVVVNNNISESENDRHRVKDVRTIEFRLFDSTNSKEAILTTLYWLKLLCYVLDFDKIYQQLQKYEINYLFMLTRLQREVVAQNRDYFNLFNTDINVLLYNISRKYELQRYCYFSPFPLGNLSENFLENRNDYYDFVRPIKNIISELIQKYDKR